jgi:hypothetical protein
VSSDQSSACTLLRGHSTSDVYQTGASPQYHEGVDMLQIATREGFAPCNLARLMLSRVRQRTPCLRVHCCCAASATDSPPPTDVYGCMQLLEVPNPKDDKVHVAHFIREPDLLPGRRLANNVHGAPRVFVLGFVQ